MRTNGRNLIMKNDLFELDRELAEIEQITLQDTAELINTILDLDKVSASCVGKSINLDLLAEIKS